MVLNKRGFTLVELLLVIAILVVLMIMMIGAYDPGLMVEKARDAKRKKDAGRIRVAFEEYFNDKGCFPSQAMIDNLACDKDGFLPWLPDWPCDPNGPKYHIYMDGSACPKYYRILVNLKNRKDRDIPTGWYSKSLDQHFGDGTLTINDINYGVSSQNIYWYTEAVPAYCYTAFAGCYIIPGPGRCSALAPGVEHVDSYLNPNCLSDCLVSCCINGRICSE
jgi:prepilin-type N-terminal cleavage/methylation domain-containing protein